MKPRLDQTNLFARVPAPPGVVGVPGPRYELGEILGAGSTSTVHRARDTNFAREVAVKIIDGEVVSDPERLAEFITEARISAALEHPNIVPVYDMDRTSDGGVFLTMRVVSGMSLAEAIEQALTAPAPESIRTVNDRINVMLQVANALAAAHHQRIVHRDIKPANIMLGRFGEVFLVDWGTALTLPPDGPAPASEMRIGTPLYMSPEQSRGEAIDERSDVYCFGATLFHALLLRPPTQVDSTDRFWQRKVAGEIDAPAKGEGHGVDPRLLAILRKALAAEVGQRYQRIEDVTSDLRAWQSGQAISAVHETWLERFLRWHRRWAKVLWPAVAIVLLLLTMTGWWWSEHEKDRERWGDPVLVEDFDAATWQKRWLTESLERSRLEVQDGRLVTRGPVQNFAFLRNQLSGRVALEFTGMMRAGFPDGDLSVVWSAEDPHLPPTSEPKHRWLLQVGAEDNLYATIVRTFDDVRLAVAPVRLQRNRPYRLRAEIDGDRLVLQLDGKIILEHHAETPFTSGWIGFYGYYPGKEFSQVRLYAKGLPERVSVLTLGDNDLQDGLGLRAAEQYRRVTETFGASSLGQEALYRQGLALRQAEQPEAARQAWSGLSDPLFQALAACWQATDLIQANDIASALRLLDPGLPIRDPRLESRRSLAWIAACKRAIQRDDRALCDDLLAWQQQHLAGDRQSSEQAAKTYIWLGRPQVVLERFADQPRALPRALLDLGRYAELLERCESVQDRARALLLMGRYDEVLRDYPWVDWAVGVARLQRGESSQILAERLAEGEAPDQNQGLLIVTGNPEAVLRSTRQPADLNARVMALLALGRFEEAAAMTTLSLNAAARCRLGMATEVAAEAGADTTSLTIAQGSLLVEALARGDRAACQQLCVKLDLGGAQPERGWFGRSVLVAYARWRLGDQQAFAATLAQRTGERRWQDAQRQWYALSLLAGTIDASAYLAQPARSDAANTLPLLQAIQAEIAGRRSEARNGYLAWQVKPTHLRSVDGATYDPVSELYVAWRLTELRP